MSSLPGLPDALTTRALQVADSAGVTEVMAEQELAECGRVEIEEGDILGDWARPSFDLASSTVGVFEGERLVAYAEVGVAERGDAAVRPAYGGRGIGTWLAHWMQVSARGRGWAEVGMDVVAQGSGDRLLASLGYRARWTSWALTLAADDQVPCRPVARGFAVREAHADEHRQLHAIIDTAFSEWPDRQPEPFEDFEARFLNRSDSAPWNLRLVTDAADRPVGAAVVRVAQPGSQEPEGYIPVLGVHVDHRGRGLGQALMADAFAVARGHGAITCGLSTDSRTGALGLYLKVGMQVSETWVHRSIALG